MTRIVLGVTAIYVILGAAVMALWPGAAWPHSWYDSACCSGLDCAAVKITPEMIDIGPAGITVTIQPGEHPIMQHAFGRRFFSWDALGIRQSQDDDWHVCISGHVQEAGEFAGMHRIYCVYVPPFGL